MAKPSIVAIAIVWCLVLQSACTRSTNHAKCLALKNDWRSKANHARGTQSSSTATLMRREAFEDLMNAGKSEDSKDIKTQFKHRLSVLKNKVPKVANRSKDKKATRCPLGVCRCRGEMCIGEMKAEGRKLSYIEMKERRKTVCEYKVVVTRCRLREMNRYKELPRSEQHEFLQAYRGLELQCFCNPVAFNEKFNDGEGRARYDFQKVVGQGSFGTILEALESQPPSRKVAVKFIPRELRSPAIKDEFAIYTEVAEINDWVPKVREYIEVERNIFFITEFAEGKEVHEIWWHNRDSGMPPLEVYWIFKQLAQAVEILHSNGIVHRDLKLENLMYDRNGNSEGKLALLDFGFGAKLPEKGANLHVACGTPEYVAPEVFDKKKGGYREEVDIWAMGVCLYLLIFGRYPFEGRNQQETLDQIKVGITNQTLKDLRVPKLWRPQPHSEKAYGEALDLLNRMLEKDRKKRINIDGVLEHQWMKDMKTWEESSKGPKGCCIIL